MRLKRITGTFFLLSLFLVIISVVQPISEQGCVANIEYELDVSKHTTILLSNIVSCKKHMFNINTSTKTNRDNYWSNIFVLKWLKSVHVCIFVFYISRGIEWPLMHDYNILQYYVDVDANATT